MPQTLKDIKILIIEDSLTAAISLQCMLESYSADRYNAIIEYNLKDGINYILFNKGFNLDIILLDLILSNGEGINVLKSVKDAAGNIPIIVITTDETRETAEQAIDCGAQDYLIKGYFSQIDLIRAINNALKRYAYLSRMYKFQEKAMLVSEKLDKDIKKNNHDTRH